MKIAKLVLLRALLVGVLSLSLQLAMLHAQSDPPHTSGPTILNREQAAAILPPSVFYRGQSASTQGRNSAGLKLDGDKLVLFTLVDTSGYSTAVKQTYQAYLLTEVSLTLGGQTLQPGAYGFGFVAGDKAVFMDIGANEVLSVSTTPDPALKRPNPLQIVADANAGPYRLYLGRNYVTFSPSAK